MKRHIYVMIDVEADGQIPGDYSMISLGAVEADFHDSKTKSEFYVELRPISEQWDENALRVSGFTREQTMAFPPAFEGMKKFYEWSNGLKTKHNDRLMFVSDNNGFDWMYVNWYFHHFLHTNPYGHSSTNLGSLYKGLERSMFANFKKLRDTKHTHNALDDAKGNAEAFIKIMKDIKAK